MITREWKQRFLGIALILAFLVSFIAAISYSVRGRDGAMVVCAQKDAVAVRRYGGGYVCVLEAK